MAQGAIGTSVTRLEDDRLLTGAGRYTDNRPLGDDLHAAFVRSPHAHADILSIDTDEARSMPGVVAIYCGPDVAHLGPIPTINPVVPRDGSGMVEPPRRALAQGRVRHIGECVAIVIAETRNQADDAAEAVFVDFDALASVVDEVKALQDGAPQVWAQASGNLCYDWDSGDLAATNAAFDQAAHVVRLAFDGNRVHYGAIEARSAIVEPSDNGLTLYCPSQGAHLQQMLFAEHVFAKPKDWLRVVTGDVGGGFGPKYFAYPETAALLFAADTLGRTVRWAARQDESFLSDAQSRAQTSEIELALDAEGIFLAVRISAVANLGAYLSTFGPGIPTTGMARVATGGYAIPVAHIRVRGAFTNTVTVDAFRGAGGPDPMTMVEHIVDLAAAQTGIDRLELRRRNLVRPDAMPWTTPLGMVFDSGDFVAVLEAACDKADWTGFAARRVASEAVGMRRGIGLSAYVHGTGGITDEHSVVTVDAGGFVMASTGGQSTGQGHETAFAQIIAAAFDLPYDDIRVVQGDTTMNARGGGTGGSSSTVISGATLARAAEKAANKGLEIAAHVLEAAAEDIEIADGGYRIRGTDRRIGLYELAARLAELTDLPDHLAGDIEGQSEFEDEKGTFPQGAIVGEVEIDPQTGFVRLDRVTSVVDVGVVINPALVAAQMHGGIVQGLGQVFWENLVYDDDSGQLLSGSWLDYCLPRADDVPDIDHITLNSPTANNHLGVKGVGELGSIGAPAAAINAVADALGAQKMQGRVSLPLTSEAVWRIMNGN